MTVEFGCRKTRQTAGMPRKCCRQGPNSIAEADRDYYLERRYPTFGNLVPRDVASRAAKVVCDEGRGVAFQGNGVYLDFRDAIKRLGQQGVSERYGNLFEMYQRITGDNPYETPMRIFPCDALHDGWSVGRLQLAEQRPGLVCHWEANFSITAPTDWAQAHSCRGLRMATLYCLTPSVITSQKWEPVH